MFSSKKGCDSSCSAKDFSATTPLASSYDCSLSTSFTSITCNNDGDVERLYFFDHAFDGTLSSFIGKLSALTELYIDGNKPQTKGLKSTLPTELKLLTRLNSLNIVDNYIDGALSIPTGTSLTHLRISSNLLNGTINSFPESLTYIAVWFDFFWKLLFFFVKNYLYLVGSK